MKNWFIILLALPLLTACQSDQKPAPVLNQKAPDLALLNLDGETVDRSEFRGHTVLMSFWFAGCGPCTAELPLLEQYQLTAHENGIKLVIINMRDKAEVVRDTARRMGLTLPMTVDALGITSKRYGVTGAPTNFVISADGKLIQRIDGAIDWKFLDNDLIAIAKKP